MITKKNRPMRAIFFRDHEISGLRPTAADPLTVGVRGAGHEKARPAVTASSATAVTGGACGD
ncbi:MAG: hypothetical protein WAK58_12375, partial [Trebonia sp.]